MSIAYLNGEYLPLENAHVSVMDRGFLFGDAIYEVIPVFGGKLFRIEQHLRRLRRSLAGIQLDIPISDEQWQAILQKLVDLNNDGDQSLYLQITRGPAPQRRLAVPEKINPTIFAFSQQLHTHPIDVLEKGVSAVLMEDSRWQLCQIKATTLLANVLLHQEGLNQGADEVILYKQGNAIEATSSNLFMVKDGKVITPPKDNNMLLGVTRELVLELLAANNIPHAQADIRCEQLCQADEVWLTGSSKEIIPVIELDKQPVGHGKAGPVWQQVIALYKTYRGQFSHDTR